MSAQAKAISEVVKDFEQSLRTYRPSTRRVYVAGARAAIRAASLELWQSPSTNEILASIGKSPIEKRARISPFLDFLDGGRSKKSVSDEERVARQNWVIQTIEKQMRFVKNPSIAIRRDMALIVAICAAPARGTPRKWPESCLKITEGEVLLWDAPIQEPCFAISLRFWHARLERTAGPARPTAALPQIAQMEPIKTPIPRTQRRSLGPSSLAQRSAATQRGGRARQHPAHHSGKDQNRFPLSGSSQWRDRLHARAPRGFRAALIRV